jgi:hypothetical protein
MVYMQVIYLGLVLRATRNFPEALEIATQNYLPEERKEVTFIFLVLPHC